MEHYSIQAVDIFIHQVAAKRGWRRGETIEYKVKNCAWESRIQLHLKTNDYGFFELYGQQTFTAGDEQKMLRDQDVTFMAFQSYINSNSEEHGVVHWLERTEAN